jgi:large subunit ribosomal protein L29
MALIKKQELKQMSEAQLSSKIVELKKEMVKLNAQRATGTTLENPGKVKQIKKMIAKLHTYKKINKVQTKEEPKKVEGGKTQKK